MDSLPFSSAFSAPWLVALCLCFAGPLVWGLFYSWHSGAYTRGQLPPGSLGLPLLGETFHFLFSKGPIGAPQPFFSSRLRRYGAISRTHILGRPTVLSMDPELNNFLLANQEKLVEVYLPKFIQKIVGPAACLQDSRHHTFRELANLSVGSNAIQKLHVEPAQEHFLECFRAWHLKPYIVVEATEQCKKWSFAYSVKYFLGLEASDPITISLMHDFFILTKGMSSIPISFPGTPFYKALKATERVNSTFRKIVSSRKLEARNEEKDFLDILLKRTNESGEHCDGLHVADWIYAFVLASFETTSVLYCNIIKYLSENEHVVDELRSENTALQQTKNSKEKLTWKDYQNMRFTRNVVNETLRMASIVPLLFRITREDIYFKGIVIPKGWLVLLEFSTIHLNSAYYPDPLRFDPWRWMDSTRGSLDFFMPFSAGPRKCPGGMLATFEATIFIHYLVTRFKWARLHEGEKQGDERDCLSLPNIKNRLILKIEPLSPIAF